MSIAERLASVGGALSLNGEATSERGQQPNNLTAWVLGINAALIAVGITAVTTAIWRMSITTTELAAGQQAIAMRLASLETNVSAGTQQRYTSSDASRDRSEFFDALRRMEARVDLSAGTINRLTERIADLEKTDVRVLEKLRLETKP